MTDHSNHTAIVGGGLAGLATAAYLARSGSRVTVYERSESVGGRGGSFAKGGYVHNFGPHALYRGGKAVEVLRELGVGYTGNSPDLGGVAVRRGRTFTLPVGGRSLLTTRLFGVRSRVEAGRQLFALRKPQPGDERTVAQWLDEEMHEPGAREYVRALIRLATYADAPEHTSLQDAARQFAASGEGVVYIDGGWQTLTDGMRDVVAAVGGEIRTGGRVEGVASEGGSWAVHSEGGRTDAFDAVVLAVPPAVAATLRPGSVALARYATEAIPARAACLDVGLRRLPNPRRRFGLGIDSPLYLSVHSLYAQLAPEGRTMVSVAKYIAPGAAQDAERDLAELEGFLDTVQPGWRELEEHRQYLPNMVVSSALPRDDRGGIAGRPRASESGEDGLFIAGDWVGTGGWLADGALGSAQEAAAAVREFVAAKAERPLAAAVG